MSHPNNPLGLLGTYLAWTQKFQDSGRYCAQGAMVNWAYTLFVRLTIETIDEIDLTHTHLYSLLGRPNEIRSYNPWNHKSSAAHTMRGFRVCWHCALTMLFRHVLPTGAQHDLFRLQFSWYLCSHLLMYKPAARDVRFQREVSLCCNHGTFTMTDLARHFHVKVRAAILNHILQHRRVKSLALSNALHLHNQFFITLLFARENP